MIRERRLGVEVSVMVAQLAAYSRSLEILLLHKNTGKLT